MHALENYYGHGVVSTRVIIMRSSVRPPLLFFYCCCYYYYIIVISYSVIMRASPRWTIYDALKVVYGCLNVEYIILLLYVYGQKA